MAAAQDSSGPADLSELLKFVQKEVEALESLEQNLANNKKDESSQSVTEQQVKTSVPKNIKYAKKSKKSVAKRQLQYDQCGEYEEIISGMNLISLNTEKTPLASHKKLRAKLLGKKIVTSTPLKTDSLLLPSKWSLKKPFCGKENISPNDLSPVKLYKCGICKITFFNNAILLQHIKRKHNRVFSIFKPRYSCGSCPARFYRNSVLIKHCRANHSYPNNRKTPKCGKNTPKKTWL